MNGQASDGEDKWWALCWRSLKATPIILISRGTEVLPVWDRGLLRDGGGAVGFNLRRLRVFIFVKG